MLCYFQVYIQVNLLYTHKSPLFLDSFLTHALKEYRAEFSVRCCRFSVACFTHSGVWSIPASQVIPLPEPW